MYYIAQSAMLKTLLMIATYSYRLILRNVVLNILIGSSLQPIATGLNYKNDKSDLKTGSLQNLDSGLDWTMTGLWTHSFYTYVQ